MAGFDRVRVDSNQRGESQDFNATNELALLNIARAMRGFFAPIPSRVYRGFLVTETDPVSASVDVHPGAAMDATYQMIVLDSTTSLVVSENASGNQRIDIVQIKYTDAEAQSESRQKWNPATEAWYAHNVNVRRTATATVAIKAGTPGANPVAPSPDTGYFAIAQILVPASWTGGGRTIDDGDITNLPGARGTGLVASSWVSGQAGIHNFPTDFVTSTILSLETPEGMNTVIAMNVTWQSGDAAEQPLRFQIEDAASGDIVGAVADLHSGTGDVLDWRAGTTWILGTVAGPTDGVRNYRLRIKRVDDGQGGDLVSTIYFRDVTNAGLDNRIFALTF